MLYVRLLSTEVDALKTPDQWGAEMSGQTDTERNPLRLAAPMRLALPASLVMAASPQGQHALTMLRDMLEGTANVDASGLTAYQMLPALGGFANRDVQAWRGMAGHATGAAGGGRRFRRSRQPDGAHLGRLINVSRLLELVRPREGTM